MDSVTAGLGTMMWGLVLVDLGYGHHLVVGSHDHLSDLLLDHRPCFYWLAWRVHRREQHMYRSGWVAICNFTILLRITLWGRLSGWLWIGKFRGMVLEGNTLGEQRCWLVGKVWGQLGT